MTKSELIDAVAKETGMKKTETSNAIDAVFTAIQNELKTGGSVRLIGFGSFSVTKRAAREGRNPRTGQPLKIAASKAPKFTAGKELKTAVNG